MPHPTRIEIVRLDVNDFIVLAGDNPDPQRLAWEEMLAQVIFLTAPAEVGRGEPRFTPRHRHGGAQS